MEDLYKNNLNNLISNNELETNVKKDSSNKSAKKILDYLLSNVSSNYEIMENPDTKVVRLKVLLNKNDYNFLLKNKALLSSIKTITMSYGAKLNKKILIDFILKKR
jgi:hypothetical protein